MRDAIGPRVLGDVALRPPLTVVVAYRCGRGQGADEYLWIGQPQERRQGAAVAAPKHNDRRLRGNELRHQVRVVGQDELRLEPLDVVRGHALAVVARFCEEHDGAQLRSQVVHEAGARPEVGDRAFVAGVEEDRIFAVGFDQVALSKGARVTGHVCQGLREPLRLVAAAHCEAEQPCSPKHMWPHR